MIAQPLNDGIALLLRLDMLDKPHEEALAHVSLRAEVTDCLRVRGEAGHVGQAAGGQHEHDVE